MNEIKIIKKEYLDTLNHHYFQFTFKGIPKDGVDEEKVDDILDKWIKVYAHYWTEENVRTLRTILRDYQEKLFSLYFKSNEEEETIEYKNGKLSYVHVSQKHGKNKLNVEYVKGGSFSFSCTDLEKEKVFSEKSNIDMVEKMEEIKNSIVDLSNVSKVELSENAKIVIQLYQLFYNENPDFSKHNIDEKIQNMMVILSAFGISIPEMCNFSIFDGKLVSFSLKFLLNKLYPYGEIKEIKNPVSFQDDVIERAKIIGQFVIEFINKYENPMENLKNIAWIIHHNRYTLTKNVDINYLAERTELNENEIIEAFSLGRNIWKEIRKKEIY